MEGDSPGSKDGEEGQNASTKFSQHVVQRREFAQHGVRDAKTLSCRKWTDLTAKPCVVQRSPGFGAHGKSCSTVSVTLSPCRAEEVRVWR